MAELIIAEKPSSAQKIAEALGGKVSKKISQKVSYFQVETKERKILVVGAAGHLFGLDEKERKDFFSYPVFDIAWKPLFQIKKDLSFTKNFIEVIKSLSKEADKFTIACDYDIEGELIGWNILRFVCQQKDAHRMKFSTLIKPDLIKAYQEKSPHLNWGQALAGETRHVLDWFYGINLSRALSSSLKRNSFFKIMSIGRVQGPILKLIEEREKLIESFLPEPYWQIQLLWNKFEAWHQEDKLWEKKKAEKIFEKIKKEKKAFVKEIEKKKFKVLPPYPFDLTTLQTESYRLFRIKPEETLELAQDLYLASYISYPRTSSQQLPEKIGFKKLIEDLSQQKNYLKLCQELLKEKKLLPYNGKKTDPAHPAIYPTGIIPKDLKEKEKKIYDLIVRRTLSTFAQPAIRETMKIIFEVKNELFISQGSRTVEKNWFEFYQPYVRLEETELPELKKGIFVDIKKINLLEKETQPPKRYSPSSIIKELEKRNLGTKATRASILETLYKRGYIIDEQIRITPLGRQTIKTLERFSPQILDENLTRHFEEEMELINQREIESQEVIEEAKKVLLPILNDFKKNEEKIGKELVLAYQESEKEERTLGRCPACQKGNLVIKFNPKYKQDFIGCDQYPECSLTVSLPKKVKVKKTGKLCSACSYPIVKIKKREFCLNPDCPGKEIKFKKDEKCPQCRGNLIIRKSLYGQFIACQNYPRCKFVKK